jgi:sulfate adenylyltransferase subunit 1 (EFTu-like GTPase family)
MDLMAFDQDVFEKIVDDFDDVLKGRVRFAIPMSALLGDNVITKSDRTPYFDEARCSVSRDHELSATPGAVPLPVQMVLRPDDVFAATRADRVGHRPRRRSVTTWPSRPIGARAGSSPSMATSTGVRACR